MSKIDTSSWKEFKLSELFDIRTTKAIDRKNVNFIENGECDFIGRTSVDYGIQGTLNRLNYEPNKCGTFSLVQVGETCCLFRERPWYASQNIFILEPKYYELIKNQLFIKTMIDKNLEIYKTAYTYPTLSVLKDLTIRLPAKESNEPNWEYMQERIAELEQERIAELEQYLIATELNDYELTEEEEKILNGLEDREWKEYRIGELFDVHPTKAYKFSNAKLYEKKGNTPVLSNSSINNGIGGYCGLDATEEGQIITFSDTTTGTDTMFYQSKEFIGYAHVQGMYPKQEDLKYHFNENIALYFISIMKATFGNDYTYANKFTRKIVTNTSISLPTINNHPDWNYMEKYMKAMEKVVIKDVVRFKDEVIEKTKNIVLGVRTV